MIAIAFITFRESLEMLLIFGVLFASLKESKIQKKGELLLGSFLGLLVSMVFFVLISFAGSKVSFTLNKQMNELFESLNYLGSGIFLFISAIVLHNKMKHILAKASSLLLGTSLFFIGFLSILREGMEIIAFSISTSITSPLSSSLIGFLIGLMLTCLVGIVGKRVFISRFSHGKLLTIIDWGIRLISLYLLAKGLVGLSEFVI